MASDFKVTIKDKEVEFTVRRPTSFETQQGEKIYRKAFRESMENGDLLRVKLDEHLRKAGIWSDEKQAEHDRLVRDITDSELALAKGGMKLTEARDIALKLRKARSEYFSLLTIKTPYDNLTCEAQADNARFNYFVSACTVYKDNGKPYYKDMNAFIEDEGPVGIQAAMNLMKMMTDYDENLDSTFAENKFLKKYGFVDEKLRLINKDGKLIDSEGRLITEEGHYIDENGNRIDKHGRPLEQDGDWKVEFQPFLDDNGNPLEEKTDEAQADN